MHASAAGATGVRPCYARRVSQPTSSAKRGSLALVAAAVAIAIGAACGPSSAPDVTVRYDGGDDAEASAPVDASPDGPLFDPTLGGPCTADAQCDDGIACTFDRCDRTIDRCRNTPDDTQCADTVHCNGREVCVPRLGCRPGAPVTCQDGSSCTIDACVEETKSCSRVPRDVDGDGEADDHCLAEKGTDCDDLDPLVGATKTEICGNGKDDNCNRRVDETPCASPQDDTCTTARTVGAPARVVLTTVAAKKDFAPVCSVGTPGAARDVVVRIEVPGAVGDPPRDLEVWATAPSGDTAVALLSACTPSGSSLACGHTTLSPEARARARSVTPGTYYAVVTTQAETTIDLAVDLLPATGTPANESCSAPKAVPLDTSFGVELVDAAKDLASTCASETGELTFSFTLTEPKDVTLVTSRTRGSGSVVASFRDAACTGEIRCRSGSVPPLLARSLPAGTHVFSIAATAALDANVIVRTAPPTAPPANGSCTAPPTIPHDGTVTERLSGYDELMAGCLPGGPTAAYTLVLAQPSDVLLVGRFPPTEQGAVSLSEPGCTVADRIVCQRDGTPARIARRNLGPGTYRALVQDERGELVSLGAFVRPTLAPVQVQADGCADAFTIPPTGGFFTGDTTSKNADFPAGCDSVGGNPNGANDQMLKLVLGERKRVILDMQGSSYATLLDLRSGASCPGIEVPDACYVGFRASRSFLDRTLDAGTYWVQIDGHAGASGAWNLDVRVLPP